MKFQISSFEFRVRAFPRKGKRPSLRHSPLAIHHSAGASLVECLVYISLFGAFIIMVMTTFYQTRDASDVLQRQADELTRALHAGERWREDVRTASAAPRELEQDGQRWLAIPHGAHTVDYLHFRDTVWRREGTNAWQPVLARVQGSQMLVEPRQHVAAWRWEVELQLQDPRKRTKPLYTFLAVAPVETSRRP